MPVDLGAFIDARTVRYLRNRVQDHDALYWTERLGVHFIRDHDAHGCESHSDMCWQLVSTEDAQQLYLKTHDDRLTAIIVRARIVSVDPEVFTDSRGYERRQSKENAVVAQEEERVRRYMMYGKQALKRREDRPRDSRTSLGRRFPESPTF